MNNLIFKNNSGSFPCEIVQTNERGCTINVFNYHGLYEDQKLYLSCQRHGGMLFLNGVCIL